MINDILVIWNDFVLAYFIGLNGVYLALIVLSYFSINRYLKASSFLDDKKLFRSSSLLKPISIIAPAYNESQTVITNMRSLMMLNYPSYEIILVNDGSSDDTLEKVRDYFEMRKSAKAAIGHIPTAKIKAIYRSAKYPNLTMVDKENGGKADALNVGINLSRNPLVTAIDTDSLLERDVLLKMVRPFIERPETIAVGGVVRIINGCKVKAEKLVEIGLPTKMVPLFQIIEYFRAFFFGRVGWETMNMLLIISGAFGIFRKKELLEVNGYRSDTIGEDMDLIVRLHKHMIDKKKKYHIGFVAEPVCWTEAPESYAVLKSQRNRWHRGLLDALNYNRSMIFNPKYGRIGMFAMPFALIVEGLGPIVEFLGFFTVAYAYYIGSLNITFALAFLSAAVLLGVVMSTSALIIEELTFRRYPSFKNIFILFLVAIVENFGYRQLNSWWRFLAIFDFLKGKQGWGSMTRTGFETQKETGEGEKTIGIIDPEAETTVEKAKRENKAGGGEA